MNLVHVPDKTSSRRKAARPSPVDVEKKPPPGPIGRRRSTPSGLEVVLGSAGCGRRRRAKSGRRMESGRPSQDVAGRRRRGKERRGLDDGGPIARRILQSSQGTRTRRQGMQVRTCTVLLRFDLNNAHDSTIVARGFRVLEIAGRGTGEAVGPARQLATPRARRGERTQRANFRAGFPVVSYESTL